MLRGDAAPGESDHRGRLPSPEADPGTDRRADIEGIKTLGKSIRFSGQLSGQLGGGGVDHHHPSIRPALAV